MNNGMPPRCRNQRAPTAEDTPIASAALSLGIPVAICTQNCRSTSRRSAGGPGERIASLPVNCFIHPAGRPIHTSGLKVLRRPIESALTAAIRVLHEAGRRPSPPDGVLQGTQGQRRGHRRARRPADHHPRREIDQHRDMRIPQVTQCLWSIQTHQATESALNIVRGHTRGFSLGQGH